MKARHCSLCGRLASEARPECAIRTENELLREALRETLEVVEGETCGECGLDLAECECDGSAWWRRARAALKGGR